MIAKEPYCSIEHKKRRYCFLTYDFIKINYNLSEEGQEKVRKLFYSMADEYYNNGGKNSLTIAYGITFGSIFRIPISIAEKALSKLKEIVLDKKNWKLLGDWVPEEMR